MPGATPKISVIITSHNYGHFLGACLDSVAAQLDPPHQVIVVDDGSTDMSRDLLAGRAGIEVILQDNGGQAAAFNRGFAASSGDAILFLDADDMLRPEAIRVIAALWCGDHAGLSFDLEAVDLNGSAIGHYPMRGARGDQRHRLLKELAIDFMPTSGNVWARWAIEWAFPLAEDRWRISADALLARAAMLKGPVRHVPHTLGHYRMHGHNGYFADAMPHLWQVRRACADMAEAGLELVCMIDRSRCRDLAQMRPLLLRAAVRRRMTADRGAFDRRDLKRFLSRVWKLNFGRSGLGLVALFSIARVALPRSVALRTWAADRPERPNWVQWLVRTLEGRARDSPDPARSGVCASDLPWQATDEQMASVFSGPDWHGSEGSAIVLCSATGSFSLVRLIEGPCWLELDLEPGLPDLPVRVSLSRDGQLLDQCDLTERQACRFLLPELGPWPTTTERFAVSVDIAARGIRGWWTRPLQPCRRLYVHAARLVAAPPTSSGMVLPLGGHRAFAEVWGIVARRAADPSGHRPAGRIDIPLVPPPFARSGTLSLILSERQCDGWLDVWFRGRIVVSHAVAAGAEVLIPLSDIGYDPAAELLVTLAFHADDALASNGLDLAALGWADAGEGAEAVALFAPGTYRSGVEPGSLRQVLAEGWDETGDGPPVMNGLSGGLKLAIAPEARDGNAEAVLDLEPVAPVPNGHSLVVIVLVGQTQVDARQLAGNARFTVPLSQLEDDGTAAITLLAALRRVDEDAPALAAHGGVRLCGLGLAPRRDGAVRRHAAAPKRPSDVEIREDLAALATDLTEGRLADLAERRQRLTAALPELSDKAAKAIVTPEVLDLCAQAGACLRSTDQPESPAEARKALGFQSRLALAALGQPAWLALGDARLAEFPPMSRAAARAVAKYLVADARPDAGAAARDGQMSWLTGLLGQARAAIAADAPGHPQRLLADCIVDEVRLDRLLSAPGDTSAIANALCLTIETSLLAEGASLYWQFPEARAPGPLRIAILARTGDAGRELADLSSLADSLTNARSDLTILLEGEARGLAPTASRMVNLAGIALPHAVATVRAMEFDLLLLASRITGADRFARLAAHRLARRQVSLAPVGCAAAGLRSVDGVLPVEVQAAPVMAPGQTGHDADGGAPNRRSGAGADRVLKRARLGLPLDGVVLFADAPAPQVSPELIENWLRIVAASQGATLVMRPFADETPGAGAVAAFRHWIENCGDRAGLAPGRIRLVSPRTDGEPADWLTAADIYLDSFPVSNLTGAVRAMEAGLPVITLRQPGAAPQGASRLLTALGLESLVAADIDAYADNGAQIAVAGPRRAEIREKLARANVYTLHRGSLQRALEALLPDIPTEPDRPVRYLFHHMPKAGGISLRHMFSQWFRIVLDYREPWGPDDPPPLDLGAIGAGDLLIGHFATDGVPLATRYPEVADTDRWRRICFVRDPLELALSYYFFERKTRPDTDPAFRAQPLGTFLREYPGIYLKHFECDLSNWRETVEKYWFIGTLERLPDCMDWLANALGKPPPAKVLHYHTTERDEEPLAEDVEIFVRNMAHEFEMYRWIADRLQARLSSQPAG